MQRIGIHRPRIRRERPRHEVLPPGRHARRPRSARRDAISGRRPDSSTNTSATRPRWDLADLTAALGDDLAWNIVGSALDPFGPRQIRAARQRLPPALVRIHKLPGSHLTISEHPDLQPASSAGSRNLGPTAPSHPTSPDDLA